MRTWRKKIIVGLLIILIFTGLGYGAYYIITFPQRYPNRTLVIEAQFVNFFHSVTWPIKVAKLYQQEPDTEIIMPVYGARRRQVADTWLATRDQDRQHEGQDIFAARGTPIFSGTRGYLLKFSDSAIGGNSVYIIGAGGGGYFFTHPGRFAGGPQGGPPASTRTTHGFFGDTGNAQTTPAHLHLGMYQGEAALDPLPLLVDRP